MTQNEEIKVLAQVVRCPNCLSQDLVFAVCGCVNCIFCFEYLMCDFHYEQYKIKNTETT